jgi:hypothetical protein
MRFSSLVRLSFFILVTPFGSGSLWLLEIPHCSEDAMTSLDRPAAIQTIANK